MPKISLRAYDREIEVLIEQEQRLDEAIAHCTCILELYPRHLDTLRLLGKVHLEAKRYEQAVDIFERVLASAPEDFVSHVGLSVIAGDTGKLTEAIWHMERAFEAQPSNAAIQGELQRLFGRRDGIEPPKIRLTRGALAHMYMQGELYSQAISEAKGVLLSDSKRTDMRCLLAEAYFRNRQQTEAIQVCTELLGAYPYCLDANRLMAQMLKGSGQEGLAEQFLQRLNELDPYAAFATESVLDTAAVADSAVILERLDYSGLEPDLGTDARLEVESKPSGIADDASAPSWLSAAASKQSLQALGSRAMDDIPAFLREASRVDRRFDSEDVSTKDAEEVESMPGEATDMLPSWMRPVPLANDAAVQAVAAQSDPPRWLTKSGDSRSAAGDHLTAGTEDSQIRESASGHPGEVDDAVAWSGNPSSRTAEEPDPVLRNLAAPESSDSASEEQRTPGNVDQSGMLVESYLEAGHVDEATAPDVGGIANDLASDWGNDVDVVDDSGGEATEGEDARTPIIEELDAPDWLFEADPAEIEPSISDEVPESLLQFETRMDDPNPYDGLDIARSGPPPGVTSKDEMPPWLRPGVDPKLQSTTLRPSSDWRPLEPDELSGTDISGRHGEVEGLIASESSESESRPGTGANPDAARMPTDRTALRPGARPKAMEPVPRGEEGVSLAVAQSALGRGNISAALDAYGNLIRKAKSLEEIIRDLRDALYRYPVEVPIWQALGDAYMRANRVQEALGAYTRAEELLR